MAGPRRVCSIYSSFARVFSRHFRNKRLIPRNATKSQRFECFKLRARGISFQNRLMMVHIWLRSYPCDATLSLMCDVPLATVAYIIESMIQPLHALYAGSVRWPTVAEWTTMRRDMASVVGMIDATSHRIYKPMAERVSLYYSGHRHFHYVLTQVVVDNNGVLRYIKTGFMGHNNDAVTFRLLPSIGPNAELDFPGDCYLTADKIYPSHYPLLTPFSATQILRRPLPNRAAYRRINRKLSKIRILVEHAIRNLKLFKVIGSIYRYTRRSIVVIVELCAGLAHRRALILSKL